MHLSHSLNGTIGYVGVRYEGGESGKMAQSLREREGLRKEHWYSAEQPVWKSRLRIRAKSRERNLEVTQKVLLGQANWAAGYKMQPRMSPKERECSGQSRPENRRVKIRQQKENRCERSRPKEDERRGNTAYKLWTRELEERNDAFRLLS